MTNRRSLTNGSPCGVLLKTLGVRAKTGSPKTYVPVANGSKAGKNPAEESR